MELGKRKSTEKPSTDEWEEKWYGSDVTILRKELPCERYVVLNEKTGELGHLFVCIRRKMWWVKKLEGDAMDDENVAGGGDAYC